MQVIGAGLPRTGTMSMRRPASTLLREMRLTGPFRIALVVAALLAATALIG
jgi:hypothetical protein